MAPRKPRMLRGLNPDRDIIDDTATASVEHQIAEDVGATKTKHTTRSTRNGRSDVIYDMKYHPMDDVTRPNARATQRNRSNSVSFADNLELLDDESESSELSSADIVSASDSAEVESVSDSPEQREPLPPPPTKRAKDLSAERHSSRAEAKKFVHYDTKSHPSDYALPGYRHRAKYAPPSESAVSSTKTRKRRILEDSASDAGQPDASAANALSRPRKKVKSLQSVDNSASKPSTPVKRGRGRPPKSSKRLACNSDEITELVDQAIQGSQFLPVVLSSGIPDSEHIEEDIAGAFEDLPMIVTEQDTQDAASHLQDAMSPSSEISDAGADRHSTPKQTEKSMVSLASIHRFPEYVLDRHVFGKAGVLLTTDAAFEIMLEDFRSDHDVELAIQKPYLIDAYTSNSEYGKEVYNKPTNSSPGSDPYWRHVSQLMDLNGEHKLVADSEHLGQSDDMTATVAEASNGDKHSLADKARLSLGIAASPTAVDQLQKDADDSAISAETAENSRYSSGHEEIPDSNDDDSECHSPITNPADVEDHGHDDRADCSSQHHFEEQIAITESRFESDADGDDIGLQEISKWHNDDKAEDNESYPDEGPESGDLP